MEREYSDTIKANVRVPLRFLFAIVKCLKPIYDNFKGKQHVSCPDLSAISSFQSRMKYSDEAMQSFLYAMQVWKTNTMNWGNFHQNFIGYLEGWKNLRQGHSSKLDVMHEGNKMLAEIKNNENTMNSDSMKSVYQKLVDVIANGWNALLVIMNGDVTDKILYNGIRQISGKTFYAESTGILTFHNDLVHTTNWLIANYETYEDLLVACSITEDELVDVIDINGDLTDLSVNQLKEVIKSINLSTSKKLPVTGTKTVLIERIKKHREGIA